MTGANDPTQWITGPGTEWWRKALFFAAFFYRPGAGPKCAYPPIEPYWGVGGVSAKRFEFEDVKDVPLQDHKKFDRELAEEGHRDIVGVLELLDGRFVAIVSRAGSGHIVAADSLEAALCSLPEEDRQRLRAPG
jgi:hypothetical protein